ncbi:hypothetical protein ES703_47568 [subsurface metagenome]
MMTILEEIIQMAFNYDVILSPAKNLMAGGSLKPALSEAEGRGLGMARGR